MATNVAAGATYGYLLVWVVVVANLMACLVQFLSAKLGLVTGQSLPEALRDRMPPGPAAGLLGAGRTGRDGTDLAEVLGGAIALNILFDLPLLLGGVITGVVSTVLLAVQNRRGQQPFERVITGLLAVIAIGFFAGLFVSPPSLPDPGGSAAGVRRPGQCAARRGDARRDRHATRRIPALGARQRPARPSRRVRQPQTLLTATKYDVGAAMLLAGAVNLAMLLLAATALQGPDTGGSLQGAHDAVSATLGAPSLCCSRSRCSPRVWRPPPSAATPARWSWTGCSGAGSRCWCGEPSR